VFPGTKSTLESIIDSPLRQRIKDGILEGQSTVWILVEGTDQTANEAIFKLLNDTLLEAQKNIQIPEGVIQADQAGKVGEDINLDDVLRSSIPLQISFKPPTGIPHPKNHLSSRSLVVVARQAHF